MFSSGKKTRYVVDRLKMTKNNVMEAKNSFANKMIDTGLTLQQAAMDPTGFMNDNRAMGDMKGIMVALVGGVVVIKLASTLLPQASSDWSAATAEGGLMANASASDKSTWNTGGSMIPIAGVLIVAGIAIRSFGN